MEHAARGPRCKTAFHRRHLRRYHHRRRRPRRPRLRRRRLRHRARRAGTAHTKRDAKLLGAPTTSRTRRARPTCLHRRHRRTSSRTRTPSGVRSSCGAAKRRWHLTPTARYRGGTSAPSPTCRGCSKHRRVLSLKCVHVMPPCQHATRLGHEQRHAYRLCALLNPRPIRSPSAQPVLTCPPPRVRVQTCSTTRPASTSPSIAGI